MDPFSSIRTAHGKRAGHAPPFSTPQFTALLVLSRAACIVGTHTNIFDRTFLELASGELIIAILPWQ